MSEYKVKISADVTDFANGARRAVAEINGIQQAARAAEQSQAQTTRIRAEIHKLNTQARKEAFAALPAEVQLNQLLAQRAKNMERMAKVGGGSERRKAALELNGRLLDRDIATVRGRIGADASNAAAAHQERQQARMLERQREMFALARRGRDAAYDRLGPEEKLTRLFERREKLARFMERAAGNELRLAQLKISARRTDLAIGDQIAARQRGGMAGVMSTLLPAWLVGGGAGVIAATGARRAWRANRELLEFAGDTSDRAARLATTPETVQEFGFAAKRSGISDEDVATSFRQLQIARDAALSGTSRFIESFSRFNVSVDDLRRKSPEEIFKQMARNAGEAGQASATLKDAVNLLGQSADKTFGAFRNGFAAAMDEIRNAGGVIQTEVIGALDDAGDRWETVGMRIKSIFAPLRPLIADLNTGAVSLMDKLQAGSVTRWWLQFGRAKLSGKGVGESTRHADNITRAEQDRADNEAADIDRTAQFSAAEKAEVQFKQGQINRVSAKLAELGEKDKSPAAEEMRGLIERWQDDIQRLKSGVDPDVARTERVNELTNQLNTLNESARWSALTPEEKYNEILKERKKLTDEIAGLENKIKQGFGVESLNKEQLLIKRIEATQQDAVLSELKRDMEATREQPHTERGGRPANELVRVGAVDPNTRHLFGQKNLELRMLEANNKYLEKIERALARELKVHIADF